MKLTRNNRSVLIRLVLLGAITGTLAWSLAELLFARAGFPFSLAVGPIGFDLHVLSVSILVNPGSLLGCGGGLILFKSL